MPVDIAVCTVWLYVCRLKENVKHLETLLSQSEGSFDRLDRELVTITKVTENSYMIVHVYMNIHVVSSLLIIIAMQLYMHICIFCDLSTFELTPTIIDYM